MKHWYGIEKRNRDDCYSWKSDGKGDGDRKGVKLRLGNSGWVDG